MRQFSGQEFARLLERHGWQLLRITGSHHIYGRRGSNLRISVPIHGNRALKTDCFVGWSRWLKFLKTN